MQNRSLFRKLVLKLFVFVSLLLISCNFNPIVNKKQQSSCNCIDTNMNYYRKAVIFWNLPEKEREKRIKKFDADLEADIYDYYTMAQAFLFEECDKKNIVIKFDRNDCCGLIFDNGDTVKLHKKDSKEVNDLWWIILFDGVKQPKVVSPVLIEDSFFEYFKVMSHLAPTRE